MLELTAAVAAALAVREQKHQAGRRSGLPGYPGVSHRGSRRANLPATLTRSVQADISAARTLPTRLTTTEIRLPHGADL